MPALFVLPRQVPLSSSAGLLAGAKLTFSATGTSTLQNTYSDVALTVPNANPVVADANGVFGKIYLDGSLPNYRVKLTTSANVLIYQEDDIPSNQNTSQVFRLKATAPELIFEETDAGTDSKKWSLRANTEVLSIDLLDDAESTRTNVASITRAAIFQIASKRATTTDTNSFTATLTGMSATTTGSMIYEIIGRWAALYMGFSAAAVTGTSNSTSFTVTGLPAAVVPAAAVQVPCILTNNGTLVSGTAAIASGGSTITFSMGSPLSTTGFTNSGTKGLPQGWSIMFPRNTFT
jgi:hypothetical protein